MTAAPDFRQGPLSGVRVLDLTSVIMGPFASHILADLGADVIKVESPEGDSIRWHDPSRHGGMSGTFLNLNRNKRSIVLDLKRDEDAERLRGLIATADVFLHSIRPDAIARLGFAYADVAAINAKIVYCGAYGFGADGPYRNKAAYDDVIQAGSGLASLATGDGSPPSYAPTVVCDKLAGQAIAYSILAAIIRRLRGGGGANIEVPMFETAIEFNLVEHICGGAFVPQMGPMGYPRVVAGSRRPFRTLDGYACILPYSNRNWRDFFEFVGRPSVMDEPRFAELAGRVRHIQELYAVVEAEAVKRTTAEWMAFCDEVSIPAMPVLGLEQLADDPHVQAVGLFQEHTHPTEGAYRLVRRPVTIDGSGFQLRRHAPRLGEHTIEVLAELERPLDAPEGPSGGLPPSPGRAQR